MVYQHNSHSKYLLSYHIIFVCKYRKTLLQKYFKDLKKIIFDVEKYNDFTILEQAIDKDHLHLLIRSVPKISALQIVRRLKQVTTNRLWNKFSSELKTEYWKRKIFWSSGYFISTIGNASAKTIEHYIQNQG